MLKLQGGFFSDIYIINWYFFKYCEKFKLPFNDKTEKEAIKWSLQRGNRTGRSAWQFIINYAAENNKKIDI